RVAHLVGLERQRTRIAMDLHDEMGGALGAIGIQAGMLAGGSVGARGRRLAREIARTTDVLGDTLADLVWSLDPRVSTLRDLALRLEQRGRRLFADGTTAFEVLRPPAWPKGDLPAPVRRNVLLVGIEALRNAAVHAGAKRVVLEMAALDRGRWRLAVRDDGRGMPATDSGPAGGDPGEPRREGRDGMGILSMRERAREVGAEIEWRRSASGGTEVTLLYRPRGRRSLRRRLRRLWGRLVDRMNVLVRGR
ncbi:MAG TPA: ATP-binding protein, partial [Gemmatimonadota bacterium]|nr:ATP-binding protein [Gemmatimonadota bacterium]